MENTYSRGSSESAQGFRSDVKSREPSENSTYLLNIVHSITAPGSYRLGLYLLNYLFKKNVFFNKTLSHQTLNLEFLKLFTPACMSECSYMLGCQNTRTVSWLADLLKTSTILRIRNKKVIQRHLFSREHFGYCAAEGGGGFQECAAQVRHWSARRSCRTSTVCCRAHVCLSSHFAPFAVVLTCAVHRAAFRPLSLSIDADKSVRYSATLSAARPIAAKRGRRGRSTNYMNNTQLSKSGQNFQNK